MIYQERKPSDLFLTVENGFGGRMVTSHGIYPIFFDASQFSAPFDHWKLVSGKGTFDDKSPNTSISIGDSSVVVCAVVKEGGGSGGGSGPSLETGDHKNYLNGYPDGTLRPGANLTREETAQLFYNLMDEASRAQYETTKCPFPDVKEGRWSYQAICTLANAGILKGNPDGTFRPFGTVTRAEFSSIAARFDPGTYEGDDLFPDIATHWARESINFAASKGWIEGYKDGTFQPDGKITRAEAATLINRVLNRAPETIDDLLPGRKTFPDNADPDQWYYLALEEAANSHDYRRKDYDGILETWTALN